MAITQELMNLFKAGNRQAIRATFTPAYGEPFVIRENEIISGGCVIDRACVSGEDIEIGSAIASDLTLKIKNKNGKYNDKSIMNSEVFIEIGPFADDNTTVAGWVPCGKFYVDDNPQRSETMTIKALDRMTYLDDLIDINTIKTPIRLMDVFARICAICNVPLKQRSFSYLPNANYQIKSLKDDMALGYSKDMTYRNLLQQACALTCTCAYFDGDGELVVKWFNDEGYSYGTSERYGAINMYDTASMISGVMFSRNEEVSDHTESVLYAAGNIDNAIDISDVTVLDHDIQQVLDNIYNTAQLLMYKPYETTVYSSPWLFPTSIINLILSDGSVVKSIVTNVSIKANGLTHIKGVGNQGYKFSNSKNAISKSISSIMQGSKYYLNRYYEQLNAVSGNFDNLDAKVAHIEQAYITKADIEEAHIVDAYIDNLIANKITATDLSATNGSFQNLEANLGKINTLVTGNAVIDDASVINLTAENTVIENGLISDAMILNVSANKLTTGEIDASKVRVKNLTADSIRTENLTIGGMKIVVTDNKREVTLDGGAIEEGTIPLSGLSEDVREIIDGALQTYTSDSIPTMFTYPTSEWQESEYKSHVGSICYVVNQASPDDGRAYRFVYDNSTKEYMWYLIQDSDITDLISRVGNLEKYEEEITSWKDVTDRGIESLSTRTTNVETSLGDKVDTTTFNSLKSSFDENSATLTTIKNTVENMEIGGRNYISNSLLVNENEYNYITNR